MDRASRTLVGRRWLSCVAALNVIGCGRGATAPERAAPPAVLAFTAYPGVARVNSDGTGFRYLAIDSSRIYELPVWAPDGSRLVVASFARDHSAGWATVMNADGTGRFDAAQLTIITDPIDPPDHPVWSPDDRWIAFAKDTAIQIVHPDGTGSRVVAVTPGFPLSWSWSPDSKQIAYDGTAQPPFSISLGDTDGMQASQVPGVTSAVVSGWSPRNPELWYLESHGLHVVAVDGSSDRVVVPGNTSVAGIGGATWSPDGSQIAVQQGSNVMVVNRDGSNLHTVAGGAGAVDANPAWSSDGKHVAFVEVTGSRSIALFIVGPDGSGLTTVYQTSSELASPAWQPTAAAP